MSSLSPQPPGGSPARTRRALPLSPRHDSASAPPPTASESPSRATPPPYKHPTRSRLSSLSQNNRALSLSSNHRRILGSPSSRRLEPRRNEWSHQELRRVHRSPFV